MTRAAGYVRVSTREQALDGYSLEAQEHAIRQYCAQRGWDVVDIYVEPGRSGKSRIGRDALTRILQDAKAGHFERFVVWNMKRFARNLLDTLTICQQLAEVDVMLVSVVEAFDASTPSGRAMRNMVATFAEYDRETIVEAIKLGIEEKARQGESAGPVPLGYRRDEGRVTQDVNAPMVLQLFERYATGTQSLRQLAAWAVTQGMRSTKGNVIDRLSLRKVLTNPFYQGDIAFHGRKASRQVFEGTHAPIVSRELFAEVQRRLSERQRKHEGPRFGKAAYTVTGVSRCGYCGAQMTGSSGPRGQYLRCSTSARRGRGACVQPMVNVKAIEDQIGAYVDTMQLPEEGMEAVMDELRRRRRQSDTTIELERVQGEFARWRRMYAKGDIEEAEYSRTVMPMKARIDELQRGVIPLDVEAALRYLSEVGGLWRMSDQPKQREFVNQVFERIVIEDHQVKEITPRSVYAPMFVLDRAARFEGALGCIVAPRAGVEGAQIQSAYEPVTNIKTGVPFLVPALVMAGAP